MALTADLFPPDLPDGCVHLKGAVSGEDQNRLVAAVRRVAKRAPFSHARTKSGGIYSAEMTNCGQVGWWSDAKGCRYTTTHPDSGLPWPPMPRTLTAALNAALAGTAADGFSPDACLINHYAPGAKMGLHQDKDEADFSQPIVTLCLGAAADFLMGGTERRDKSAAIVVESGDVVILGGPGRLCFHGIRKIYPGTSPLAGPIANLEGRLSLTFRKAL